MTPKVYLYHCRPVELHPPSPTPPPHPIKLKTRTFLSLHELADGLHEIFFRFYLVRGTNHCLAILQIVLVCVEPHLFFILQSPRVTTKAMVS